MRQCEVKSYQNPIFKCVEWCFQFHIEFCIEFELRKLNFRPSCAELRYSVASAILFMIETANVPLERVAVSKRTLPTRAIIINHVTQNYQSATLKVHFILEIPDFSLK